jgi:organic hydroperoxide reductase OsmC/OhrA
MMGSFARLLAEKKVLTREDLYWADVEGDIENVNGVLKITQIRVKYHLKAPTDSIADVEEVYARYLTFCPAAQSVIGCIDIKDELIYEK